MDLLGLEGSEFEVEPLSIIVDEGASCKIDELSSRDSHAELPWLGFLFLA